MPDIDNNDLSNEIDNEQPLSSQNDSAPASPFEESESDKPVKGIEQPQPTSSSEAPILEKAKNKIGEVAANISQSLEKSTGFGFYTPTDTRPSMEEFLGTTDYSLLKAGKDIITGDFSNPDINAVMDKTLAGRIAKTIGQNTYEAYKQGGIGTETGGTTDKFFKDIGLYNDLQNNRLNSLKTADEAFIRPMAAAIDTGWRLAQAAVTGGLTTISSIPEETASSLGGPAPELVEWAMTDLPTLEALMPHVPKPSNISKGNEMGVYAGERAYFDIDTPTREDMLNRISASNETYRLQNFVDKQTDVHYIARTIAPETFARFDELNTQKEGLRDQLQTARAEQEEAIGAKYSDEIAEIQNKLDTKSNKGLYSNMLEKKIAERDAEISTLQDTPEMEDLRKQFQAVDYSSRDMAPDVSAAMREAESRLPKREELEEPKQEIVPEEPQELESQQKPIEDQLQSIRDEVTKQAVAAGRPADEAEQAAELIAQHSKSMAEQGWTKGTAEEIYQRDAAKIAGREGLKHEKAKGLYREATHTIHLFEKADASTLIHEKGHEWLNEMMHYAKADDAPASLLKDSTTVKKWLNLPEDAEIQAKTSTGRYVYTKQHEKFARGFERYLMEGAAPSRELANVFTKFKKWLTDIYDTVAKLRAPITDDIRDVFDRLLSANPDRTVIAPERNIPGNIEKNEPLPSIISPSSAITEKDISTGNNIESTIGGIPQGDAQVPPNISKAEEAQRKPIKPEPEMTEAQKAYSGSQSKYLDKAGNIRLDLLNVNEDIKQAIRDSAERNGDFTNWTRGKISDAEALALAQAGGMKIEDLDKFAIGKAYSAEEIIQLQLLLNNASADVTTATKAFREAKTDETRLDMAEKVARFEMIQDTVQSRAAGARAEAGRALHTIYAMRKLSGSVEADALGKLLKEQTGFDLFQMDNLADAISRLDSPDKVAGFINEMREPSLGDKTLEVFTNWLISNPVTHAIYLKSNMLLALYKATAETAVEATVGALRGSKERVYLGEVNAQLYSVFKGGADGWQAAKNAFKLGQTIELPMEAVDRLTTIQRELYNKELVSGKTPEEAIAAVGGVSPIKTAFTQTKNIEGKLGVAVRIPGERMVAPIHSWSRTIGYTQSIARQAYRVAKDEGLEGYEFTKRVNDLTTRPTDVMMTEARREATEQTLMSQGGELTKRISALANWEKELPILGVTKPLRFIDPFLHINASMFEQGPLSRSPLGLLSKVVMDDIKGKNGEFAQNRRIARITLGTSLMIATGGLAMQKLINGSGPKDPKESRMWQMVNGMPNSFRIGDMSYDLHKLGSLGEVIGIGADLYEASSQIGKEDASKVASMLVHSVSKNFLEESSMRGPSDFMEVMNDSDRYGEKYVRNFISTLVVPFSMGTGQLAREIDPDVREVRTVMDAIKAKIPYASETLQPLVDIWGEEIKNKDMSWLLSYEKQIHNDPVNQRLFDLNIFPAPPRRQILGVELTNKQYHDYSVLAGRMTKQALDEYVQTTNAHDIPPGEDIRMIHNIMKMHRAMAAQTIANNYPEITNTAEVNKRSIADTGKKANKQEE